jgi:hypothetical protein
MNLFEDTNPRALKDLLAEIHNRSAVEGTAIGAEPVPVFSFLDADGVVVTIGRDRYIRSSGGREELFDVVSDPFETTDLSGDPNHRQAMACMRALVRDRTARRPDSRKEPGRPARTGAG